MDTTLIIDNREKELIIRLKQKYPEITFEIQTLNLGDIQLIYTENSTGTSTGDSTVSHSTGITQPIFIIERKTLKDLKSSINDGRYREQKARLMNHRKEHGSRLLYIFEGAHHGPRAVPERTLLSCCVNTAMRDRIPVHRTQSIEGTVLFIMKLLKNINKWPVGWNNGTPIEYSSTLRSKKKDNMTPEVCFVRQLSSIPGIAATSAHQIKEQYKCMSNLIKAYLLIENEGEREDLLKDVKINGRRLGKIRSARVHQYLFS